MVVREGGHGGVARGATRLDLSQPPMRSSCSAGNRQPVAAVCSARANRAGIRWPVRRGSSATRHPAHRHPNPKRHPYRPPAAGRTSAPVMAEPGSARPEPVRAGSTGWRAGPAGRLNPGAAAAAALARAAARAPDTLAGADDGRVAACAVRGGDLVRYATAVGARDRATGGGGIAGAFHRTCTYGGGRVAAGAGGASRPGGARRAHARRRRRLRRRADARRRHRGRRRPRHDLPVLLLEGPPARRRARHLDR